jgi:DNA-directed RNA polymerase subunit M/transcription elongation factor TFIIS
MGKDIRFCPECSRILYFKEDDKNEEDLSSLQFALDEEYVEDELEEEEDEEEEYSGESDEE